jgi:hypothetical protein
MLLLTIALLPKHLAGIVFYKIKVAHLGKKLLSKRSPPHSVFSVR